MWGTGIRLSSLGTTPHITAELLYAVLVQLSYLCRALKWYTDLNVLHFVLCVECKLSAASRH